VSTFRYGGRPVVTRRVLALVVIIPMLLFGAAVPLATFAGRSAMTSSLRLAARVLLGVALVLGASAGASAGADDYDGSYSGVIRCEAIPGQTTGRLQTDFTMKVAAGKVEYQRPVLQPTSRVRTGVIERGTGTVSPEGAISLIGGASGRDWNYEASYQGRVTGTSVQLSGSQLWRLPGRAEHSRPCTIALARSAPRN
jgi:hypothetical protein